MKAILVFSLLLGVLAGCGVKGAPNPAGPADKIIYPRTYPTK